MAVTAPTPLFGDGPPLVAADALPAHTAEGAARRAALAQWPVPAAEGTQVTYESRGRVLVIGPPAAINSVRARLPDALTPSFLPTLATSEETTAGPSGSSGKNAGLASDVTVSGHLGAFHVTARWNGREWDVGLVLELEEGEAFDLVLDLQSVPAIEREELPPGYFAPPDDGALDSALAELPGLVGELTKPRFFEHNDTICAHSFRGNIGCTACIDACPAEAISSVKGRVETDPYRCLGCGTCATVCPTGATRYAQPRSMTLVSRLQEVLESYRATGGRAPTLLLYSHDRPVTTTVTEGAPHLAESIVPLAVHDIGSVGLEAWLAALAAGAGRVVLLFSPSDPGSKRDASASQVRVAQTLLEALGHEPERVSMIFTDDLPAAGGDPLSPIVDKPIGSLGGRDKRSMVLLALQHLIDASKPSNAVTALPAGAPFGKLEIDPDACTLCMTCVAACPRHALAGEQDSRLEFREDRCVQCGLCANTCPESAITLVPRFAAGALRESAPVVLNEAEMQRCPGCGAATYPGPMVDKVLEKLAAAGRDVGPDSEARRRLLACEDCRSRGRV